MGQDFQDLGVGDRGAECHVHAAILDPNKLLDIPEIDHQRQVLALAADQKADVGSSREYGRFRQLCAELDRLRPRKNGASYAELISFVTDRPGHDWRYAIDDSKAATDLGFQQRYDLATGLRQTVEWYLAHEEWSRGVQAKLAQEEKQ